MQIKGQDLDLVTPKSVADCYDVLNAVSSNPIRGQACALGLCASGPGRPPIRRTDSSAEGWLAWGGAIIDHYAGIGVGLSDWIPAGQAALDLVAQAVAGTTNDEVTKIEGNSRKRNGRSSG